MKETYSKREIIHKAINLIRLYHYNYEFKKDILGGSDSYYILKCSEVTSNLYLLGFITYREYVWLDRCVAKKFED